LLLLPVGGVLLRIPNCKLACMCRNAHIPCFILY
jgi:hypothetical protein